MRRLTEKTALRNNVLLVIITVLLLGMSPFANAVSSAFSGKYTGVFRGDANPTKIWIGAPSIQVIKEKMASFGAGGYLLKDIEVHKVNGSIRYDGIFEKASGSQTIYLYNSWNSFMDRWKNQKNKGRILVDFESFKVGNTQKYLGIFRGGLQTISTIINGDGWKNFTSRWKTLIKQGYRLKDVESYPYNGKQRFVGVFHGGSGKYGLYMHSDWNTIKKIIGDHEKNGFRMIDFEQFKIGNNKRYLVVLEGGTDGRGFWVNQDWKSFSSKYNQWSNDGLYLVDYEHSQ